MLSGRFLSVMVVVGGLYIRGGGLSNAGVYDVRVRYRAKEKSGPDLGREGGEGEKKRKQEREGRTRACRCSDANAKRDGVGGFER